MPRGLRLTPFAAALIILAVSVAAIGGARVYEALGYLPCELCYKERIPYYAAFALAPAAAFAARRGRARLMRILFVALALLFAGDAALSVYHSLVEMKIVAGPSDCSGALSRAASVDDFLAQIKSVKVVRCDEPNLRVLGLTLANWNVLITAALAVLAVFAATRKIARPGDPPPYAALFDRAFERGFAIKVSGAGEGTPPNWVRTSFRTLELGRLSIRSGRITACDPFLYASRPPFTQPVTNGEHRVRLAIVERGMSDGRVAFARVDLAPGPVVDWKLALLEGQALSDIKPDDIFGYPVDAGTGAFLDPLAGEAAEQLRAQERDVWEQWQHAGEENGRRVHLKPNFFLMLPMPPANIAMFASGWGDGHYASWFGYAADGRAAALVTDFCVEDWAEGVERAADAYRNVMDS